MIYQTEIVCCVWWSGKGECQVGSTNVQECRDSTVALWIGCVTEAAAPPLLSEPPTGPWEWTKQAASWKHSLPLSLSLSHVHTHNYSLTTLYSGVSVYYKDSVRETKWRGRIRFSYGIFIRPFPVISPPTSTSFKLGAPALIVANFYFKGWKQKKL